MPAAASGATRAERVRDVAHRRDAGADQVLGGHDHRLQRVLGAGDRARGEEEPDPGGEPLAAGDAARQVRELEVQVGVHERGEEHRVEPLGRGRSAPRPRRAGRPRGRASPSSAIAPSRIAAHAARAPRRPSPRPEEHPRRADDARAHAAASPTPLVPHVPPRRRGSPRRGCAARPRPSPSRTWCPRRRRRSPRSSPSRSRCSPCAAPPARRRRPSSPTTPGGSARCRARAARARSRAGTRARSCRAAASRVFAGWNGQQMKAVKPRVSSCSSRSRMRWATRWRGSSPTPNIMVAVLLSPFRWAAFMTASHSSVEHLSGAIRRRTSSSRISAPPPGIESSPAAMSRSMVVVERRARSCGRCARSPRARARAG